MRLTTVMKGGLIACILLMSVNLSLKEAATWAPLARPSECGSRAVARPPS